MVVGGSQVPAFESSIHAREWYVALLLGEVDNDDPSRYWSKCGLTRPFPPHWCGAFALWGLREAMLCDWDWIIGKGFLYRLKRTKYPVTGDLAYFNKNQHHAVYDGLAQLINGNGAGGQVTVTQKCEPDAWFSIGQLVAPFDLSDLPGGEGE